MSTVPNTEGAAAPVRPRSAERAARIRWIRRTTVPRAMIERATGRRLAGDWRGACAAARVDVEIDLYEVRRRHGSELADAVREDLRHLVPDLLRWHFPRAPYGPAVLVPGTAVTLSHPLGAPGPSLVARTPKGRDARAQRIAVGLRLEFKLARRRHDEASLWASSRYLWDDRYVHETRERWGGGPDRVPFLNPDGTPRTLGELPTADPGPGDPAARTEWIEGLYWSGRVAEALTAAGIAFDPGDFAGKEPPSRLFHLSPVRLAAEFPRLLATGDPGCTGIRPGWGSAGFAVENDGGRPRLRAFEQAYTLPSIPKPLPEALWERPPDIDAVLGGTSPDHLHPLVRDALAPARPPADGPVGPPPWKPLDPFRVRCGGEWHTVALTGGRLAIPHDDAEVSREATLRTLGGTSNGCFLAAQAWADGRGRLPKALRLLRSDLFERSRHGDTGAVLAYLGAGGDPRVRDGEGNTLLHRLHLLDHEVLLPRLLAAGADLDAVNQEGYTPLGLAAADGGGVPLLRALLDAGARTEAVAPERGGSGRRSLADVLEERAASADRARARELEELL